MNIELMERTLAHIEANPEHWQQTTWRCSTGMCFAGWAATLAGVEWVVPDPGKAYELDGNGNYTYGWCTTGDVYVPSGMEVQSACEFRGRLVASVEVVAKKVLGLNGWQARQLFCATNNLDALRYYVEEYRVRDLEAREEEYSLKTQNTLQ